MSIPTITLDLLDNPNNPDHAHGRATAYDHIHNGEPLTTLEDRLAWMEDPTVSGTTYTAAYLTGYRAQIADWRAYDYAQRIATTHNAWETPR
ncbi:hypothetical protein PV409_36475 [Streptomyces sp. ME02-6979.5a]|uniref:hypothetical protein n=1 Tax=Streptomyces sp. ME02-6979.5a TaxID=462925 RepID=UPI0029AB114B|nr:hypothetical protein [Streptomyces sp. ME02-6979.5a]MDX3343458.1 hypothetical protein [Streptomyces sp. ME02-6979.5a]